MISADPDWAAKFNLDAQDPLAVRNEG